MRGFTLTVLAVVTSVGLSTASLAGKQLLHVLQSSYQDHVSHGWEYRRTILVHRTTRLLIVRPTSAYCSI